MKTTGKQTANTGKKDVQGPGDDVPVPAMQSGNSRGGSPLSLATRSAGSRRIAVPCGTFVNRNVSEPRSEL